MADDVDLLSKSHDYLKEAQTATKDLFLLAGIYEVKKNLLNYYRGDLDKPVHSINAILGLLDGMIGYLAFGDVEYIPFKELLKLRILWKAELDGR
jgi:hypothetical protein